MSELIKTTQSAHWYDQQGEPRYEATLREARKENLLPSITTVLGLLNKPALINWKIEQGILSALTLPRPEGITDDEFAKLIVADAEETSKKAAQKGTDIHKAVEEYLTDRSRELPEYIRTWIDDNIEQSIEVEASKANIEYGYGGRIDCLCRTIYGKIALIDFKTQTAKNDKLSFWPDWCYQLAAQYYCYLPRYKIGNHHVDRICSVVIGTNCELVDMKEWTMEEIERGWLMFYHLLQCWRLDKKFMYKRI